MNIQQYQMRSSSQGVANPHQNAMSPLQQRFYGGQLRPQGLADGTVGYALPGQQRSPMQVPMGTQQPGMPPIQQPAPYQPWWQQQPKPGMGQQYRMLGRGGNVGGMYQRDAMGLGRMPEGDSMTSMGGMAMGGGYQPWWQQQQPNPMQMRAPMQLY